MQARTRRAPNAASHETYDYDKQLEQQLEQIETLKAEQSSSESSSRHPVQQADSMLLMQQSATAQGTHDACVHVDDANKIGTAANDRAHNHCARTNDAGADIDASDGAKAGANVHAHSAQVDHFTAAASRAGALQSDAEGENAQSEGEDPHEKQWKRWSAGHEWGKPAVLEYLSRLRLRASTHTYNTLIYALTTRGRLQVCAPCFCAFVCV